MQQPEQKKMAIAFWVLAFADITGLALNVEMLHFIAKPLLIPALLLLLIFTKSNIAGKNLLLAGLFFSWIGDVFLLFEYKNAWFFIFGLASFLTTHIFYIAYFLRIRAASISLLKKQPVLVALVLGYGMSLVLLLYPHLNNLKLPVIIYAVVICTMLLCSLHVFLKVNRSAALYYFSAAAAFVISDSLLALNKFYQPFAFSGVLIMLTYCVAQFFIVYGYTQQTTA